MMQCPSRILRQRKKKKLIKTQSNFSYDILVFFFQSIFSSKIVTLYSIQLNSTVFRKKEYCRTDVEEKKKIILTRIYNFLSWYPNFHELS